MLEKIYNLAVTKIGLDPIKAWDYTPYELTLLCEQVIEKNKRDIDELIFVAWHVEAFARQKRLPNLTQLIKDTHRKKNTSRADEILKAMAREKGVIL